MAAELVPNLICLQLQHHQLIFGSAAGSVGDVAHGLLEERELNSIAAGCIRRGKVHMGPHNL